MTTASYPVADTLIAQLGGAGQLRAMLGTTLLAVDENSVCFDFRMCRRANRCKVTYQPGLDVYRVEFYLIRANRAICNLVDSFDLVYADQLRSLFESTTGLRMSLR
jgi:hypothetical protein